MDSSDSSRTLNGDPIKWYWQVLRDRITELEQQLESLIPKEQRNNQYPDSATYPTPNP